MLSRVTVLVLIMVGCGFDLALESLRQRELRYAIQDVDQELGYAELRRDSGLSEFQRAVVDTSFGVDAPFRPFQPETAVAKTPRRAPTGALAATEGGRR